jgi:hypothetical protein
MVPGVPYQWQIFYFFPLFQVESTGSLHKIEDEESLQEKEAREKFEAGQALLNSSRGDKIQVNTIQQGSWIRIQAAWIRIDFIRLDPDLFGQKIPNKRKKIRKFPVLRFWMISLRFIGVSTSLYYIPHGGLGETYVAIFDKKNFFSTVKLYNLWSSNP